MNITTIGLDIAKRVFHVVCCNQQGRLIKKKMLKRAQVHLFFQNLQPCLVALEACATSHYWAREIESCAHTVKLIPPQHLPGKDIQYSCVTEIQYYGERLTR